MNEEKTVEQKTEQKTKRQPGAEGHGIKKIRAERKRRRQAVKQNRKGK